MSVHKASARNLFFCKWRENGKEKRRYFKTEEEALAFESEKLATESSDDERLTLGELVALYFRSNPDKNPHTKKNIVYMLAGHDDKHGNHIHGTGEFLRDKYAESLTRRDLEKLREAYRARNTGNNTINKYQSYIRAILAWGVDQDLIRINPWRDYKLLKTKKYIITASVENLQKVYAELPDYLQWAVKTAYFLALRPGYVELFSLRWEAFNWRRGIVFVRQGKTGFIKTVIPHEGYMVEARYRFENDMAAGIPLVCHRNGKKVLSFKTAWKNACKRAKVQMRPYDIRHVAASEMLAHGADLAAVAAQLGHHSVATTGATYAHITQGSQARAAALMPALGGGDTVVIQNLSKK